ncbi:hypothetical protein GCM10028820_16610 [Tessaracoccus terricola]
MVSIVIAAHNESDVLGATLDALLAGGSGAEIIVVPNGCTDDTAEVARSRAGVKVVEVEQGSKPVALNAGDAVATSYPRIYLDADIIVPPGGVQALVKALERPGILAAVPSRVLDTSGRPWPVRAWASVHRRLPVFRDGLFGRGMIALSQEGRERFDEFPLMVADDLFVDSLYEPEQKTEVTEVSVVVESPASTSELLHRLVRVRRGSAAMRSASRDGDLPIRVRSADRWSWLRDVVAKDLRLVPAGIVYAAITTFAALRARTQSSSSMDWGRRGATRSTSGEPTRIGFLGVQADTANLGLAALAYSAVAIVDRLVPGPAELVLFSVNSDESLQRMRSELGLVDKQVRAVPFRHKRPLKMVDSVRQIASCDVVLDFTGGDSFSDIYGLKRLLRKLFHKQIVLATRTPLVLAPQTYGPLKGRAGKPWFRHVVKRASLVFSRDDLSKDFLEDLVERPVHLATDVAVTLPHDPTRHRFPGDGRTRVGINVSGLLWAGGYTGDNQFGLAADYRSYCGRLVEALHDLGHEVHLVPHVLSRPWEDDTEDDVRAARELQLQHPDCVLAPAFVSPVDAKSWICHLDAFVGSRMHATIASFTSGVPTVPAAYSRKFAGFFGNLGYPVVVDLTTLSTDDAVGATLEKLSDVERLSGLAAPALESAASRITIFEQHLATVLPAT